MDELYFISENCENVTYSIDMLRVKTYIPFFFFSELEFRFDTCWAGYVDRKWNSAQIQQFQYNYNLKFESGTVYIGFLHNNERRVDNENAGYNFTIEFNPNKVKRNKVLDHILTLSKNWLLVSCDLALDLPISILDVIYDKGLKRRGDVRITGTGYDNKTITVGTGNGRFKIYNKKREAGLNILGELTRVEVSATWDGFPIRDAYKLHFPDLLPLIYTNNHLFTFEDYKDKTLLAILYAVQHGYPVNDLSRRYREKLQEMLEGGDRVRFYKKNADSVLRKTIFNYFLSVNHFN